MTKKTMPYADTTMAQVVERWRSEGAEQVASIPVRDCGKGPMLGLRPLPAPWADGECIMHNDMTSADWAMLGYARQWFKREMQDTVVTTTDEGE